MSHSVGTQIRRGLAVSLMLHLVLGVAGWLTVKPDARGTTLVDIEVAPARPTAEWLPPEKKRVDNPGPARTEDKVAQVQEPAKPTGDYAVDAGVPDAAVAVVADAAPRIASARDAGVDATVASVDFDAAPVDVDAAALATGPGAGSSVDGGGSGSGSGSGAITAVGSGSDAVTDPVVPPIAAATSPGTAANLHDYFPVGAAATLLIRFDRLRGTEWAKQTERLFQPMPDYRQLFGTKDADLASKLETLVISTPNIDDLTVTTLVGRTRLKRAELRDFLGKLSPVAWSASKGGLLGRRTAAQPNDSRVFLSPFRGWFVLAQTSDLGDLSAAGGTDLDGVEAAVKLPLWLSGIRSIETESGVASGPALVVTIALEAKRRDLGDDNYGLGISKFPSPSRVSVAAELDPQGWIVRGNLKFASASDAGEFVTAALAVQTRIRESRVLQLALGKAVTNVVDNLSVARTGDRVAYASSISIADMRAVMAVAAQQLDQHFARMRGAPP